MVSAAVVAHVVSAARLRAARRGRSARSSSSRTEARAPAIASGSRGSTTRPTPPATNSSVAVPAEVTTGAPAARASATGSPYPSQRLGEHTTAGPRDRGARASRGGTPPHPPPVAQAGRGCGQRLAPALRADDGEGHVGVAAIAVRRQPGQMGEEAGTGLLG